MAPRGAGNASAGEDVVTIFCRFDAAFARKMAAWLRAGEYLVDCGAGEGHLEEVLRREILGLQMVSLDLFPQADHVLPRDCETWEWNAASVPIFVRPCHSGFVERTVKRAFAQGARRALYVGKHSDSNFNLDLDLPGRDADDPDAYTCKLASVFRGWSGEEAERVWELTSPAVLFQTFRLVRQQSWGPNGWYWMRLRSDGWYENIGGGRTPPSGMEVREEVQARDFFDQRLDWTKSSLVVSESPAGWLGRTGEWHPCRQEDHDLCAQLVLRRSTAELEREGWVRVYGAPGTVRIFGEATTLSWSCLSECREDGLARVRLSPEQRLWLGEHGHKVEDYD
jgi:hypothetical protein